MEMRMSGNTTILSIFLFLTLVKLINISFADAAKACVGMDHTCFVNAAKQLRCWGSNDSGQGGRSEFSSIGDDPGEMSKLSPVASDVEEVACGNYFTCFKSTSQKVYCFGVNSNGQLGRTPLAPYYLYSTSDTPLALPAATKVKIVAAANVACAIVDAAIYCWGSSDYITTSSTPAQVPGIAGKSPTQIALGPNHACFLDASGEAYCWGLNNYGQLGQGTTTFSLTTPGKVQVAGTIVSVSVGYDHTCIKMSGSNKAVCFGGNVTYQVGDGTTKNRGGSATDMQNALTSSLLGPGTPYAGNTYTCVISQNDNGIYCIGWNAAYIACSTPYVSTLGATNSDYQPNNKLNIPITGAISLALGSGYHFCATNENDIYCWGANTKGQLGIGSTTNFIDCTAKAPVQKVCFEGSCTPAPPCTGTCTNQPAPVNGGLVFFIIFILLLIPTLIYVYIKRDELAKRGYPIPFLKKTAGKEISANTQAQSGLTTFKGDVSQLSSKDQTTNQATQNQTPQTPKDKISTAASNAATAISKAASNASKAAAATAKSAQNKLATSPKV